MVTATVRDRRTLLEQIQMIESFLSDGRTDEDALATCSRGWRPRDWKPGEGPCSADNCKAEHDHSPHPRETPRWQAEIDRSVDRWPRYVVLGVPRAINGIESAPLRRIVRGRACMGQSFRELGRQEGLTHPTVRARYDSALIELASQVWDDEGQPIW